MGVPLDSVCGVTNTLAFHASIIYLYYTQKIV
jgi:hypothetical protein